MSTQKFQGYPPKKGLKRKKCSICGKQMGISSFWKDKYLKDGYTSYCKFCYKERWILKNPAYQSKRKYQDMNR